MPLDPRVARFVRFLESSRPLGVAGVSLAGRREGLEALLKFSGPPPPVGAVEVGCVPGPGGPLGVRIYTPRDTSDPMLPGLVYFHGGGLCAGSALAYEPIACEIANASGCRVVSVDYRLAPEHPFPAAVDDAVAATLYVAANAAAFGIDDRRLAVGGDSAGATLAAAVCQAMAGEGRPALALQVLLCPILDYSRTTPSKQEFARGWLVDAATLAHDLEQYLPAGVDPSDPRVSPLRAASVAGLPPAIVHTAEFDMLRDEGDAYAVRLREAGVAVGYTCHPGMIHLFYGLRSVIPYAVVAFERLGRDIRSTLA